MTGKLAGLLLSGFTVLVGSLLVLGFAVGLAGARSAVAVVLVTGALAALGAAAVGPYRTFTRAPG